jgi:hypothetical protein
VFGQAVRGRPRLDLVTARSPATAARPSPQPSSPPLPAEDHPPRRPSPLPAAPADRVISAGHIRGRAVVRRSGPDVGRTQVSGLAATTLRAAPQAPRCTREDRLSLRLSLRLQYLRHARLAGAATLPTVFHGAGSPGAYRTSPVVLPIVVISARRILVLPRISSHTCATLCERVQRCVPADGGGYHDVGSLFHRIPARSNRHAASGVDPRHQAVGRMQVAGQRLAQPRQELAAADSAAQAATIADSGECGHRRSMAQLRRGGHPRFVVVMLPDRCGWSSRFATADKLPV